MNVKSLMLLLAIAGLGAGCSEDIENGGDSSATGIRSEIQIEMSGTSESQEYTKAIASESENQINDLKVYLFAAAQQDGPLLLPGNMAGRDGLRPGKPHNHQLQETGFRLFLESLDLSERAERAYLSSNSCVWQTTDRAT